MATFVPASFKKLTDYNYVGNLNLHKPQYDTQYVYRYGNQLLTGLLETLGKTKAISNIEYHHFEDDWIMPKIKATCAAGAAGAAVTFTMVSSSNLTTQVPPNRGSHTVTSYPIRLNDVILVRSGASSTTYVKCFVISISGATFSAAPIDVTESIPAIVTAQEVIIIGNMFGEGSDQPKGRVSQSVEYTNNLMIIKEAFDITGTESDMITWVEFKGADGKMGYGYMIKGEADCRTRFLNYREMMMLLGEKMTAANFNPLVIDSVEGTANVGSGFPPLDFAPDGTPLRMTEGLIPFAQQGININYSTITGWTLANLDSLIKQLDKNKGSKESLLLAGINLSLRIDDSLIDIFKNGAVSYGAFNYNKDLAVNLNYSSFQRGNYIFHKKTYDVFNDLQTLGAEGYSFPDEGLIIPMGVYTDGKTREKIPTLRVNYLQNPDGSNSREMRHWLTGGGIANNETNSVDRTQCNYLSEIGFEGFGANRFGYISRA